MHRSVRMAIAIGGVLACSSACGFRGLYLGPSDAANAGSTDATTDATTDAGTDAALDLDSGSMPLPLEGRLWAGTANGVELFAWDGTSDTWAPDPPAPPIGDDLHWIVSKRIPGTLQEVAATLSAGGPGTKLEVLSGSGMGWVEDFEVVGGDTSRLEYRDYDLAVEQASGDVLLVYGVGTAQPVFRARNGGLWTAEAPVPVNDGAGPGLDPSTGTVLWIELAARPASDEVVLLFGDQNADLVAIIWDGSAWQASGTELLDTNLWVNAFTGSLDNRAFDAAWESSSGDLLAVWGVLGGFRYSVRPPGTSWTTQPGIMPAVNGAADFVDLASDPASDHVAAGLFDLGDGVERLGLATWDGNAWLATMEYDSQTRDVNDTATGDFPGAVEWVGSSGVAVCIYADDQSATIDWWRWNGIDWQAGADVPVPGKGETESVLMRNAGAAGKLVALVSDSSSAVYAATYDGAAWFVAESGMPLTTTLARTTTVPFSFDLGP